MNIETFEIKSLEKLFGKENLPKKWIELPKSHYDNLKELSRKERRKYLKKNGLFSKGKWGWR